MASAAQSLPELLRPSIWLHEVLREELSPYLGRTETVACIVISATLVMIIGMTFRIPYTAFAAIFALLVGRETPRNVIRSAVMKVVFAVFATAYILISVQSVISSPLLHCIWVIATFFVAMFVLATAADFGSGAAFTVVIAAAVPLWDQYVSAETKVEDTLWLALSILIGIAVTTCVEVSFARFHPENQILSPISERLTAVENLLLCYADGSAAKDDAGKKVARLAILGTSDLRRALQRSGYSAHYRAQMSSVVALVGRLVDISATLRQLSFTSTEADRKRLRNLTAHIAAIRAYLVNAQTPKTSPYVLGEIPSTGMPLLIEIENTVALIDHALAHSDSTRMVPAYSDETPRWRFFVSDALSNPEHLHFALKGWCAASACYIIYTAIDWRGLSTAVTTCLVTALSTIGASRQKQALRFGGAVVGGFLFGTGSQIFILPHIDSIGGFTVLFAAVTVLASWIMTSSPRLSYFGLQIAVAFYLINLQEFAFQTSLAIARDRVAGILLGLFMMWLVFEQLGGDPASLEMKRKFASGLRQLAQFVRESSFTNLTVASERSYSLRETIGNTFDQVRALGDAVLFEFGRWRLENLALRRQVIHWQSQCRVLLLIRIALWKYRAQLPGFELPLDVLSIQQAFDYRLAHNLDVVADRMEDHSPPSLQRSIGSLYGFEESLRNQALEEPRQVLQSRLETLVSFDQQTENILLSVDKETSSFHQTMDVRYRRPRTHA